MVLDSIQCSRQETCALWTLCYFLKFYKWTDQFRGGSVLQGRKCNKCRKCYWEVLVKLFLLLEKTFFSIIMKYFIFFKKYRVLFQMVNQGGINLN